MSAETPDLKTRLKTLNAILTKKQDREIVGKALRATEGNFTEAVEKLKVELPEASLNKVTLAHSLAVLSDDHVPLVKALTKDPNVTSLRDVALNFNVEKLTALVDVKALPDNIAAATEEEKKKTSLSPCN